MIYPHLSPTYDHVQKKLAIHVLDSLYCSFLIPKQEKKLSFDEITGKWTEFI